LAVPQVPPVAGGGGSSSSSSSSSSTSSITSSIGGGRDYSCPANASDELKDLYAQGNRCAAAIAATQKNVRELKVEDALKYLDEVSFKG
jgi:hypothetical protein